MKPHDTTIELTGRVVSGGATVDGMRARIHLPASPFDRPRMRLFPSSRRECQLLMQSFKASFKGERSKSMDGSGKEKVVCTELNMLKSTTRLVSPDIERSQIVCEPVGLWHSRAPDAAHVASRSHIVFRLTPHRHLGVASHHSLRFDGSCTVENIRQLRAELIPGVIVAFDKHFVWKSKAKDDTTTRFGFQVAVLDAPGDFHEPDAVRSNLLPKFDDLLMLASLAGSHRCVCVGWQVSDGSGRISRYDRGGIGRPSPAVSSVHDTGLVPLEHFQHFVQHAWAAFQASPYSEAIRSATYSMVPSRRLTLETHYLSMFAALEEIMLVYRRLNEKELVIPRDRWGPVESAVKAAIKAELGEASKEVRSMLYDNLGGVNRVPLRRVIELFVDSQRLDLQDLWPLFCGEGDGMGAVRNKLVHGDLDSTASMGALAIAVQHLKWTLERMLLALLGWPVEKSAVRPRLLAQDATAMRRLGEARKEMARAIKPSSSRREASE